jgi:hypothetical protein
MSRLQNERGIALPLAIFALVVIGGLVAGALFVATQEQRIGRNTLRHEAAFTAAEAGMQNAVLHWNTGYQQLSMGGTVDTTATAPDGRGWYRRTIRRLGPMVFLVASEGFNQDSTSRARIGALLRLRPLEFNFKAALETQGTTRVGGSSEISGHDSVPAGWTDCPPTAPEQPGIRMPDTTALTTSGSCSGESCITGSPKVQQDTTIDTESLSTVGDIPFDSLEQYATKVVSGGSMQQILPSTIDATTCNTMDLYNWGDPVNPTGPCGGYFPIIWSQGDLTLGSGYGQGVLIVNGNLTVNGGFTFFGPVLVSKTLSTAGNGGHFNGGVIAANTDLCTSNSCATSVMGNALVSYSSCALLKALTQSATAAPLAQRSWVFLY